jgi:Na+/H+-translocating membrane pyrophosphatase
MNLLSFGLIINIRLPITGLIGSLFGLAKFSQFQLKELLFLTIGASMISVDASPVCSTFESEFTVFYNVILLSFTCVLSSIAGYLVQRFVKQFPEDHVILGTNGGLAFYTCISTLIISVFQSPLSHGSTSLINTFKFDGWNMWTCVAAILHVVYGLTVAFAIKRTDLTTRQVCSVLVSAILVIFELQQNFWNCHRRHFNDSIFSFSHFG